MKKCSFVFALTLLTLPPLAAQVSNPSIVPRATAPTACTTLPLYVLTTNGDLYGDNGSGACKVLSTPTSALSGSGTATHLPIWTAGSTLGDSPATFASSLFTFPDPVTVQAHSAHGVGSAVDTYPSTFFGPNSVISVFDETDTSAGGESGVFSQVTWNPATTATDSQQIIGLGGSARINADSQATADLSAYGGLFDAESNGTTTAMQDVEALQLYSYTNGTNTVANQNLINGDLANTAGGTTTTMLLNYETMENAGTTSAMSGDDFVLTNTGAAAGMIGSAIQLTVSGSGTVSSDVSGYQSIYIQSSASANPSDYLGFVSSPVIAAGSFSGLGIANFVADGENPITAAGTHAIPNYIGFDFEAITAPAHVINNEYGVKIDDVTQGDNNWAIKTGLGLVQFGDKVTAPNTTLTSAAPTVSASQVGFGGTTAAASNCNQSGVLTGVAGCLVINVAGTTHYVPYF